MDDIEELVWPFQVPPKDRLSDQELIRIEFLEQAHQEGFAPRVSAHFSCWMATSNDREGDIIRRSSGKRDWWEVLLSETERPRVATGFMFGFDRAADLVLRWLRGEEEEPVWVALSATATRRWRNNEYIDSENPTRAGEPGF